LFVCVYNDQQHFSYLDHNGNVQDAWYGTDGWHLQQINNGGGNGGTIPGENIIPVSASAVAVSGPFVCVYNDQQHFTFLDAEGIIWDAWKLIQN
jgi:hypothetical protein